MNHHTPALIAANDQTIADLIHSATRRVIYMAPGVRAAVGEALAERWQALGSDAVTVIVDVDSEVCRLGYGEIEALDALETAASELQSMVLTQPGVRIGLVIADDQTLVFSPTPMLIETGPAGHGKHIKPNAVRIGLPLADLERDLGAGPDGNIDRTIGLDKADRAKINASRDDLKHNPPQRFDISRKVRVFNARFEFVELSIAGAAIERKVITLPNELLGIEADSPLHHAFQTRLRLFDADSAISGKRLHELMATILNRYCTHLPRYGFIVMRNRKEALVKAVAELREAASSFEAEVREQLDEHLEKKMQSLVNVLLPIFVANPLPGWRDRMRNVQPRDLLRRLLMPTVNRMGAAIRPIEVHLLFKAVTYESLTDPSFIDQVHSRLPALDQLHDECLAVQGSLAAGYTDDDRRSRS